MALARWSGMPALGDVPVQIDVDPYMDIDAYDAEGDLMVLNLGPQHPSTHGVFRVKLYLDGEVCIKAVPYLGYLHRGVEKLCEKLTYANVIPIVDKNDYVAPMTSEWGLVAGFEKLIGVEPTPRAKVMRTILGELQRCASHLLWIGTFTLDMGGAIGGGATVFMHTFREREAILDVFAELTGCRFHYNHFTVGGQRHDVPAGWGAMVKAVCDLLEARTEEYESYLTDNTVFKARTVGVGVIDRQLCLEHGLGGPIGRASGVDFDLRRDGDDYGAYGTVDWKVHTHTDGDCYARYLVRLNELRTSIAIVRQLIDGIPEGPICSLKQVKLPGAVKPKAKASMAYAAIETPRGELGTWVMANSERKLMPHPYRCKLRPPSLHAVSLLPYICPGNNVSDIVVTLGSLDPIMGEVDR